MTTYTHATSQDFAECANCNNEVDTAEEIASYPNGNCPQCGNPWTGSEKLSTMIQVTVPKAMSGGTQ